MIIEINKIAEEYIIFKDNTLHSIEYDMACVILELAEMFGYEIESIDYKESNDVKPK